jgi:hypothetical protein
MASQTDAMETAKEILRQIIKYRFWISVGIAALFASIAYVVGSGPVRAEAKKEIDGILSAEKEVKTYSSLSIPTKEYKPIVEEKTKVVTSDVLTAWRTLYDRQAPLLTWPEGVQERFQAWGPKWPEKVSPKTIEMTIVDYIYAYPGYVDNVYKSFDPFNYETGEGVVAAPSEGDLLLPARFSEEHLPDLGKIWAAQERHWIQLTVLKVIAEVNKDAKKWDQAVVRQILQLEVGDPGAQDQRSLAKNETLEESKAIYAPGEEPPAADAGGGGMAAPGGGGRGAGGNMMTSGGGGRSRGGDAMGGGFGAGGSQAAGPETIFYVKSDSDKYKVLPFAVTVLIDQDRVQDFLVELENSPMSIQVKDFELSRPLMKVSKPEKGDAAAAFGLFGGGGGSGRMGGGGMNMGGMVGMGGMFSQMQQQAQMQAQNQRMMGDMANMASFGGGGSGAPAGKAKKGVDKRGENRKDTRDKKQQAVDSAKGPVLNDAYFDIVQVKVYGQCRFFHAPPADATVEPSTSQAAAGATPPAEQTAKAANAQAKAGAAEGTEKADASKTAPADVAPDSKDAAAAKAGGGPETKAADKTKGAGAEAAPDATKAAAPDTTKPAEGTKPAAPATKAEPAAAKGSEGKP